MDKLYKDRSPEDLQFIELVCNYILSQPYKDGDKLISQDFAGVFVEGRSRDFTLEDAAALYSFKVFSKCNYPIFCFLHDSERFLKGLNEFERGRNIDLNIVVIQIPALNSLEEYSKFCIANLYDLLPDWVENIITLQADGMLLKVGWEDYIKELNCDWISPHWKHYGTIESFIPPNNWIGHPSGWFNFTKPTAIGNGGFSYRKVSSIKQIIRYLDEHPNLVLREKYRDDNRPPMEDLLFCSFLNMFDNFKMPSLKECCGFAIDPLDENMFREFKDGKRSFYGFHYFKQKSEFPYCNH